VNDFQTIAVSSVISIVIVVAGLVIAARRSRPLSEPADTLPLFDDEAEADAFVREALKDYQRHLTEPTSEYEVVDAEGLRAGREIHHLTAPELAAEKRAESWEWSRTVQALSCDADFRAIATRLESQFPQT
jgi:hypothetical protein